jgi:hypothetical protein
VRSAIVNTAELGVLKNSLTGAPEVDYNITGAGRENLFSAVTATVALDPVSVSFGGVPSGSGQTKTLTVNLSNLTGNEAAFSLAVGAGAGGVAYSVSPDSVSLAPGGSATVTLTMTAAKGALPAGHQSTLKVSSGGNEVAHAVVFTLIK